VQETAKQVASVHPALLIVADDGQPGGWGRCLELERPVRAMGVVVGDVDAQDLLDRGGLLAQERPPRAGGLRGAGSSPWRARVVRIAVAETRTPRCTSSSWMRR
jgi:hypothetical protein